MGVSDEQGMGWLRGRLTSASEAGISVVACPGRSRIVLEVRRRIGDTACFLVPVLESTS
jgi:hypothetical protein